MTDIKEVEFRKLGTSKETIKLMEEALEKAKNGDFSNCAYVLLSRDKAVHYGWCGEGDAFAMLGAIDTMKMDFFKSKIE